jgi:hypothetical protein
MTADQLEHGGTFSGHADEPASFPISAKYEFCQIAKLEKFAHWVLDFILYFNASCRLATKERFDPAATNLNVKGGNFGIDFK